LNSAEIGGAEAIGREDVNEFTPPVGATGGRLSDIGVCSGVRRKPVKPVGPESAAFSIAYEVSEEEAVSLIVMVVLRSLISSSILYSADSTSGVSITSTTLFISSRRVKPMSRSWGSYSWLSSNITSLVRNTLSMLGTYIL
jgi:hypothetical protein